MIHEQLDIDRWKTLFPLAKLREEWVHRQSQRSDIIKLGITAEKLREQSIEMIGGDAITSPYQIAVVEQVREEALAGVDLIEKQPTDLFIFGRGEPDNRAVTKIGGLPYWPKNRPWPRKRKRFGKGDQLTFVAQFCFADSQSITGDLPGDLLLLFGDAEQLQNMQIAGFDFQWISLDESNLVTAQEIPKTDWNIPPSYGVRYPTYDLSGMSEHFKRYRSAYQLDVLEGTKIGGVPRLIQGQVKFRVATKFLCSLGSVAPIVGWPPGKIPYPYVNVPEPLTDYEKNNLMWGDSGSVYFFIDQEGQLLGDIQCY